MMLYASRLDPIDAAETRDIAPNELPYPYNWQVVKEALEFYQSIYGDMMVPGWYVVPQDLTPSVEEGESGGGWPEEMVGMLLGQLVDDIRSGYHYFEHRNELRRMKFGPFYDDD
jgi:hypothetical protein